MPLLNGDFIRELEVLKRHLDTQTRSGQSGEKTARRRGSSTEFADHRNYVPGDDLRRMDWFAFARTGTPVLKQYHADEDACARVLLDHSASMGFGTPTKLDAAKRLAGALAYLWLTSGQRFQLVGERSLPRPEGAGGVEENSLLAYPARRGPRAVAVSFSEIEALMPSGGTALASWIRSLARSARRPGLLIVISDFFDPGELLLALDLARSRGHELGLVQVLAPEDLNPTLAGDLQLQDAETGQLVSVSVDAAALDAYAATLDALTRTLAEWARKRGQRFIRVASDDDLSRAVRALIMTRTASRTHAQMGTRG